MPRKRTVQHEALQARRQDGNALFLILIAVALFAALSYAVTQSGRGSGTIDRENATINAANILNYANSVRAVVQHMGLTGNIADTQYQFSSGNAACTTADCKVFDPGGGGLTNIPPNADWLDSAWSAEAFYGVWSYNAGHNVEGIGITDNNPTGSDLVIILPWVKKAICLEINNKLGVTNPAGDAPQDSASYSPSQFTGTYGTSNIGDAGGYLTGRDAACFKATNVTGVAKTNSYHFYMVLRAR